MQLAASDYHHPRLLLIDDQTLVAELLEQMLSGADDISMLHVGEAETALEVALDYQPTVILVDLKMPRIDGFGVLAHFRSHPQTQRVPMILLSAEDMPELKARSFSEGANDYLVKWPSKLEMVARIRYHSSAYIAMKQRDEAFLSLQQSKQDLLARTRELAESQAALLHAQKIEAVGKLTGGVAHDFNNVLQAISGNLQLMKLELAGNERAQQRIAAANDGIKRGAKLAAQLLAFGRRQPLQPAVVDIGNLVYRLDDMLRRTLGDRVQVDTQVAPDAWNARVDPGQLENVLVNLAINGRDAMAGAGRLTITVTNLALDAAAVRPHPAMASGDYVAIAVADSGCGMSEDIKSRAFEPFFTTKPTGQGSGLGLSMAYGFVKQSGGHIALDSEPGRGTTVTVYLPRSREVAGAPAAAPASAIVTGGRETVLVVEDEPAVRATTVEMLRQLGYRTLEAADAQSALDIIAGGAAVDLLFTDVIMPGSLRSAELAERARDYLPRIEVLFASGFVDGRLGQEDGLPPGVSLLRKPYSAEHLAHRIRALLDRHGR